MIKDIFEERKRLNVNRGDYLDCLLEEMKKEETLLNENLVIDLLFLLVFASYESTSSAITLAVKFISDHPKVLEELTVCVFSLILWFIQSLLFQLYI